MSVIATIHVFCESSSSLGTAFINGLLAWATMLGGGTALGGGLLAALFAFDSSKAHVRADLINRGMGFGFILGMAAGATLFFVFVARLVS